MFRELFCHCSSERECEYKNMRDQGVCEDVKQMGCPCMVWSDVELIDQDGLTSDSRDGCRRKVSGSLESLLEGGVHVFSVVFDVLVYSCWMKGLQSAYPFFFSKLPFFQGRNAGFQNAYFDITFVVSCVEMLGELTVVRSMFYVRSMLSEPIGQGFPCVPDV